uniref:PiggyBac transposable element-derived protein domain-containing protein n=1 Tax=Nothobranchius furzeri TaxID=105023 RepID=A0A8C6NRK9_NOTFU
MLDQNTTFCCTNIMSCIMLVIRIEIFIDLEMSFESDSGDEEENEVICEVDKENKLPNGQLTSDVHIIPTEEGHSDSQIMRRDRYRWLKKNFISPSTDFSGQDVTNGVQSLCGPLEYFQKFVTEDMIKALADNTNQYSVQKKVSSIHTNTKEIEQKIGMYLKMGLVQMPGICMYWEADTRYSPVSDVIRNKMLTNSGNSDHGKFSSIKQYMCGKPNPRGFKLWVRTGISGILCDFDVYQGSVNGMRARSELGLSGDVVMKLASTLPHGHNYKIYADNLFTSIPLIVRLHDCGIHYTGKARQVRLPNCNLEDEKSLKKKERGSFDVRVETNHNICAVKWFDNRQVTLVSSFAGPKPVEKIQRWDKTTKKFVEVERPYIVAAYNKFIGGVDLLLICSEIQVTTEVLLFTDEGSPAAKMPKKSNSPKEVCKDMIGHFTIKADREWCRNCAKGYTNTLCKKCNVRLCFSEQNNCFLDYHN